MILETENTRKGITIVSGLPRSGTSMMMQILEAGGLEALVDDIRQADEDNPRGYYEFERVKQVSHDREWLHNADGKVVKMVYRLLQDLPPIYHYKVIFMRRDLQEVVASQETMLHRLGKPSDDIDSQRLIQIYQRHLRDTFEWLADQPNFSVLQINYHDVLDHTEQVVTTIQQFLGVDLDTDAMRRVPDGSLYIQRVERKGTVPATAG